MALSPPVAADFALPAPPARAGAHDTARRALLRHPTLIAGALTLVVILVAGVLAPLWWTGDPLEMKPAVRLRPPSAERWFGSDNFGRDIYTPPLYGSPISPTVPAAVPTLSLVLGPAPRPPLRFFPGLDLIPQPGVDRPLALPAHSVVGQHHGGRSRLRSARILDHPVSRHLPGGHGSRHQSRGGWATRSPERALKSARP